MYMRRFVCDVNTRAGVSVHVDHAHYMLVVATMLYGVQTQSYVYRFAGVMGGRRV